MSDSILAQLREVAKKAENCQNVDESIKYLTKAFALFSQESARLKESYSRLEKRFQSVSIDLDRNNKLLRKKVKELNTLSSYLNNILVHISEGIIFIDNEGIITTFNDEAEKILGIEKKDSLFKPFSDVFEDNFFNFSMKSHLFRPNIYQNSYKTLHFEDKKPIKIEISTKNVQDVYQPYKGIIILLKDITEIERLQIINSRNNRLKDIGTMAATVAHEIRNPLGGIRGYASLLYRDLENSKHLQEMAGYIIDGTKALERLVNNVLHYTRPLNPNFEIVNITPFLKDLCKFIKMDPTLSKEIHLETHFPLEEIFLNIDKDLFKSVILNLILNAYQSIENEGNVILTMIKDLNSCIITISDTGIGIDQKDLENIFSPFFTTKERGSGLGLSEAYKIIQAHLGNIEVRSKKFFGSTFTISMPIKTGRK